MNVVVDGDLICYKAACATEYNTYVYEDLRFRYKAEVVGYIKTHYDEDEIQEQIDSIVKEKIAEPIENTYHLINMQMQSLYDMIKPEGIKVFISGGDNYRYKIPYPVKYKGHRVE